MAPPLLVFMSKGLRLVTSPVNRNKISEVVRTPDRKRGRLSQSLPTARWAGLYYFLSSDELLFKGVAYGWQGNIRDRRGSIREDRHS